MKLPNLMLTIFSALLLPMTALAASPSPGALFVYEGLLTDDMGNPITSPQTVTLQITSSDTLCALYEETHNITPGSGGEFSLIVGSGTRLDSTNNTADRIFATTGSATCTSGSTMTFSGTYNQRLLRVQVGSTTLSPDITINNVPFAINAGRLEDKRASDFVQTSANISQNRVETIFNRYSILDSLLTLYSLPAGNGQILIGTGSGFTPSTLTAGSGINISNGPGTITISSAAGGGSVTNVTALSPVVVTNGATTPEISMPAANAGSSGYLTGSDWTTFSNKLDKALSPAKIYVGNAGGTATAVNVSGDATLDNSGALILNNVNTAGTYFRVVTDAKGRVTSGAATLAPADIPGLDWSKIISGQPTTLQGYGIIDAIKNLGGVPGIQSGVDAAKPAAGTTGRLYVASDTLKIYRDSGSTWNALADGGGAATPINLAADVTGVLPVANGGTGSTSATTAFNTLSPLSAKGDILAHNGTNNIRLPAGTAGQVLSVDSSQAAGLKWTTIPSGTVTSVTGTGAVTVVNNATTPEIGVNDATASAKGVVQVGSGLSVASGVISANPNTFSSAVPVNKGGTGVTTLVANRILMSNGSADAVTEFSCGLGQIINFNAANVPGCATYSAAGLLLNGGNSFTAPVTIGSNDNQPLSFRTNNAVRMTIDELGRVGIGNIPTASALSVTGTGEVAQFVSANTGGIAIDTTATNFNPSLIFKKNNLKRWTIMADAVLETGSNSGSNLSILRYSDAGAFLGSAMTIDRSNGNVGIATATPLYTLHVTGTAALSTGTAWQVVSDQRLKNIDGNYEYGLNESLAGCFGSATEKY
ncbi:tail fiber domain-containing protein [Bdellovibrio bacteriovorus]|uniref:beta strand repeat-containing protein n=1 Tax=Bdellovibrio bacteriovorus TaxID=959 RepID=UPI0021D074D0|nr:tail fiber domain-containing protein [Bdellovibrio bacteriovorus]UXR64446.1 tail fiber domain-containing protein [Bdellovibrio bacteriovorus]